jgi:hypothetical protein
VSEYEKTFISDTIDMLVGYDGYETVDGLKGLIDETRERLIELYSGEHGDMRYGGGW